MLWSLWDISLPDEKGDEGGRALSGSDSYAGEEILVAFFSSLLVALLCLANSVVDVRYSLGPP